LATMNWEPIYGKSLPEGGVFTAVTREAFRRGGYRLDVKFVPWKRAMKMSKRGDYHGILGAGQSSERKPHFTATEMVIQFEGFLFSRAEETITYTELQDLKQYTVGVVRGEVADEMLQNAGVKVERVPTYGQNLKKLMAKRISLMSGDKFLMSDLLKKHPEYQGKVKAVSPPYLVTPLCVLISKTRPDYAAVTADFNRGLQEMLNDGAFDAIVKRFGFSDLR
ncbi:MAG: transporter substrate-binding domain-containing protein, partial [Desulfobacteraceae bacterium]|nr:transporter substrate-binding domain-containing protein [Desulfobacteraceae bacterium]